MTFEQPEPFCTGCNTVGHELPEYRQMASADAAFDDETGDYTNDGWTVVEPEQIDDWIRREEGTYNHENGHFLCTPCYVRAGQPSSPTGWRAP